MYDFVACHAVRESPYTHSYTRTFPTVHTLSLTGSTYSTKGREKESIGKSTSGLNNSSYLNFYLENSHWYWIIELSYSQLKFLVTPFLSGFTWWIITPRLLKPHRGFTLWVPHSKRQLPVPLCPLLPWPDTKRCCLVFLLLSFIRRHWTHNKYTSLHKKTV